MESENCSFVLQSSNVMKIIDDYKYKIITLINQHDISDSTKKSLISNIEELNINITTYKKKPRAKHVICSQDRCLGKRADGKQCSRKRRSGENFCGTHIKGCPHGVYSKQNDHSSRKVNVVAVELNGIFYFKDDQGNIYNTDEIMANKPNPTILDPSELET